MSSNPRWTRIDPSSRPYLVEQDEVYCLGEYTIGQGYEGATNQRVHNLKRALTASSGALRYKAGEIKSFGEDIAAGIAEAARGNILLVPVPPSKPRGHPEYDDRIARACQRACEVGPGLATAELVVQVGERAAQHHGDRCAPSDLVAVWQYVPQPGPARGIVIVVDDVVTRGASFSAMRQVLTAHGHQRVYGMALAKAVNPPIDASVFEAMLQS